MAIDDRPAGDRTTADRSLWLDALIGAVVTAVLSFVPLSPVLGGGVAGYLHRERGVTVGAISGLLAALPLLVVLWIVFGVFSFVLGAAEVPQGSALVGVVLTLVVVVVVAYSAVLGAVGGVLGASVTDGQSR